MNIGFRHVYGPVPSRRLGHSLGMDALTFKSCSFDYVYCQLRRTTDHTIERKEYIPTADILDEVRHELENGDKPEYVGFAGSDEPTLHSGLDDIIRSIKAMMDVPVVVFTNGSLLWMPEVHANLAAADMVIPSLDGDDAALLDKVSRLAAFLDFDRIVGGLAAFRDALNGQIWLEVILLGGISDDDASVDAIARLAEHIRPDKMQISSVCRPPAKTYALSTPAARLLEIRKHFAGVPGMVKIITEHLDDMVHIAFRTQIEKEGILALIERRPCITAGAAAGLSIHITETIEHLKMLAADSKAVMQPKGGQVSYSAYELWTE